MRLVNRLPAWSNFGRALADDDELHRWREDQRGPKTPEKPRRISDWTDFDELIATITDLGNALRTTIIAANSEKGKGPKFKPLARPKTAAERAEARRDRETVADIIAIALGDRDVST